jgi:hypothetical protein
MRNEEFPPLLPQSRKATGWAAFLIPHSSFLTPHSIAMISVWHARKDPHRHQIPTKGSGKADPWRGWRKAQTG